MRGRVELLALRDRPPRPRCAPASRASSRKTSKHPVSEPVLGVALAGRARPPPAPARGCRAPARSLPEPPRPSREPRRPEPPPPSACGSSRSRPWSASRVRGTRPAPARRRPAARRDPARPAPTHLPRVAPLAGDASRTPQLRRGAVGPLRRDRTRGPGRGCALVVLRRLTCSSPSSTTSASTTSSSSSEAPPSADAVAGGRLLGLRRRVDLLGHLWSSPRSAPRSSR